MSSSRNKINYLFFIIFFYIFIYYIMSIKYLLIDSQYKSNPNDNNNNFTIYLHRYINIKSYLQINYLVLPRLNYLINDKNNNFIINFINDASIHSFTVLIIKQNYTPDQLCSFLNQFLSSQFGFSCLYNAQNYKILFTANVDFQIDLSQNNLYQIFNMNKQVYSSNNNQLLTNIINFNNNIRWLNLNITNITQNVMQFNNDSLSANFIIPVNSVNYSQLLQYNKINYDVKMFVNNLNINYLNITLRDNNNDLFENCLDYYFILEYNTDE